MVKKWNRYELGRVQVLKNTKAIGTLMLHCQINNDSFLLPIKQEK